VPWCETKGFRYLKQLRVEQMRQFRATWADSANYATKNLERLPEVEESQRHEEHGSADDVLLEELD
jgi:hypothetical protein